MAELDIEKLKQLRARLLRIEGPADILEAAQIPVFHWTYDLIEAHIAALEELDRLQAELYLALDVKADAENKHGELLSEHEHLLQDRDRLRTLLEEWVETGDGECRPNLRGRDCATHLMPGFPCLFGRSRAVLEGRDG